LLLTVVFGAGYLIGIALIVMLGISAMTAGEVAGKGKTLRSRLVYWPIAARRSRCTLEFWGGCVSLSG